MVSLKLESDGSGLLFMPSDVRARHDDSVYRVAGTRQL
jgi:hypothetical protein